MLDLGLVKNKLDENKNLIKVTFDFTSTNKMHVKGTNIQNVAYKYVI